MPHLKSLIGLCAVIFVMAISCSKDPAVTDNGKPTISLSKTTLKIGEPLYAITNGKPSSTSVAWTASAGQVWSTTTTDSATFLFTSPGTYQVTANYSTGSNSAYDSSTASIIVTDSIYNDTSTVNCDVIAIKNVLPGDDLNLTPVEYSDTGLVFVAHTRELYNHSPILNANGEIHITTEGYDVVIDNALIFPCFGNTAPAPALGIISLPLLTNGTHTLSFEFNGGTYSGSFVVTDTDLTITWNHSAGVTISPLTLPKIFHHS